VFGIETYLTETAAELLSEISLLVSWFLSKWSLLSTMRTNFMARTLNPATLGSYFQIDVYQIIGISSVLRSL